MVLPFALVPNVGKTDYLNDKLDLIWLNKTTPAESMNEIQPKIQFLDEGF